MSPTQFYIPEQGHCMYSLKGITQRLELATHNRPYKYLHMQTLNSKNKLCKLLFLPIAIIAETILVINSYILMLLYSELIVKDGDYHIK